MYLRTIKLATMCAALVWSFGAHVVAAQTPVEVKASNLKSSPFKAEGLTLTIRKLDDFVFASSDVRDTGGGFVSVRIENMSDKFGAFTPNRLVLVGRDGKLSSPGTERRATDRILPSELRVAPGAHLEVNYNLTERIRYPAKLYYGDALLAEIVE